MRSINENTIINAIVVFAILDAIYLIAYCHMPAMFVFLLAGLAASFFTRNVTIVLSIAIIAAHTFLAVGGRTREGLENGKGGKRKEKNGKNDKNSEGEKKNGKDKQNEEDDAENTAEYDDEDDMGEEFGNLTKAQLTELLNKRKDIQDDLHDILKAQNELVGGAQKLEPLLKKTEAFITKYKHFEEFGRKYME